MGRRSGETTVRQLLGRLVSLAVLVVVIVGVVASLTVLASNRSVESIGQRLAPASTANARLLDDLLEMQTAVRLSALTGDPATLATYRRVRDRVPDHQRDLRRRVGSADPVLSAQISRQQRSYATWVRGYAEARAASRLGDQRRDTVLYRRGTSLFEDARRANDAVAATLASQTRAAEDRAEARLTTAVVVNGLLSLAGAALLLTLGWWIARSIRQPLSALEAAVSQMAEDERVRAAPSGPREIRRVSESMNELADERQRGHELELAVRAQLREMDEAKSDFVSNVSHELRTPLTIIAGYLELLEEDLGPSSSLEQARMFEVTGRNVTRLRTLIEDLLTLNRAETRDASVREVELGRLVGEVCHDLGFMAAGRDITLSFSRPSEAVRILADPAQLHRAVLNIVSNAVKFSHDGQRVRLSLSTEGDRVLLEVEDEGIGVPPGELARLGSRFYRASNAVDRAVAGTGLGLRIVQTILSNHRGSLELLSTQGEGTTVRIRLPRHVPTAGADPEAAVESTPTEHG